jgi:tRNA G18 (ribose-2'-O)-methylase SpoU
MTQAPDLSEFTKQELKESLKEIRHPFEVDVYDSSNYFNLGSIIRTSHNFLASKIHSVNLDAFYRPATCGTAKYEEIEYSSLEQFIINSSGRSIVAFERRPPFLETEDLRSFKWPLNPIMFFGSEKTGVPQEILDIATNIVSVPMFSFHNDHNVSVCAGMVMYDWILKYYKRK